MAREFILQVFLFSGLRRMSYRTPMRQQCLAKYRTRRGWYSCAGCGKDVRKRDIAIDHIEPVVNPKTGFRDWNEYIERLFCPPAGLQVLCNNGKESCHKIKTKAENKIRRESRK